MSFGSREKLGVSSQLSSRYITYTKMEYPRWGSEKLLYVLDILLIFFYLVVHVYMEVLHPEIRFHITVKPALSNQPME